MGAPLPGLEGLPVITCHPRAKINLTLEVLGLRLDGYHQVASVLQTISLQDTLILEESDDLSPRCNLASLEGEGNLAWRAASLLREVSGCPRGAAITLEKGIPPAAGLGGGSSDAAATLQGLNQFWGLGFSRERLLPLASRLGSDVPFFLYGGTALVAGRGEQVTPLPPLPSTWLVLLTPSIEIPEKTKRLYGLLRPEHFTRGEHTRRLVQALETGSALASSHVYNVFEEVAFSFFPGLEEHRRALLQAGGGQVHLAGSGPTLFALAAGQPEGEAIKERLAREGLRAYLVVTCP